MVSPVAYDEIVQGISYDTLDLELTLLNVDYSYQRTLDVYRSREIATNWSDAVAQPIKANLRKDGSVYIIDGQHTAEAAKLRGHKTHPTVLFDGLSVQQEAAIFALTNQGRTQVSAMDLFHAAVRAGEEGAVAINRVIEKYGGKVQQLANSWGRMRNQSQDGPRPFQAVAAARTIYDQYGIDQFERVLRIVVDAWPDERAIFLREIILGVHLVTIIYSNDEGFDEKRLSTSLNGMATTKINRSARELYDSKAATSMIQAVGIVLINQYNKAKRVNRLDPIKLHSLPRGVITNSRGRGVQKAMREVANEGGVPRRATVDVFRKRRSN